MANRYRVEAWSLPLATSTKTVQAVPFLTGNFSDPVSAVGRGAITVRGDWDRLVDIDDPDNGVSSYYRVFQDNALIGGFFGHRTATEMADIGSKIVTIEGAAQGKVMEFARVENFDYPVNPSAEIDWNFGSGAAGGLENGDFEEQVGSSDFEDGKLDGWKSATGGFFKSNQVGPDVDDADAQGGTFSLFWDPGPSTHSGVSKSFTVEGGGTYTFSLYLKSTVTGRRFVLGTEFPKGSSSGTTNGYIWNGFLFAELDNVPRVASKNGTPGGSTDGTWQQMIITITYPEFDVDPTLNTKRVTVAAQFDHHGGGSHPVARVDTFVASGPGLGLKPWHRTGNTSIVSVFEQSTDFVHGDTFSAKVTTTAADHGIAQVVDNLVAGRNYTFETWVYHEDGSNQNFTVSLKHETGGSTLINSRTISVPTATWTKLDVTGVTDDDDLVVVIRKQNASTFYVDDARLYEGFPPASWGDIMEKLMDDAVLNHTAEAGDLARETLEFLNYTSWSITDDSVPNNWDPATVEYRAVRGKRYDQILNDGLGMGFEWRVRDNLALGLVLDIYNKYDFTTRTGGIGTDRRGTNVPAIKFGPGVKAGPLISSATGVNRIHTEGEDFQWDVKRDVTAIGNYDTREGYEGNVNLLGNDTLGVVADQILDRTVIPTKGIKIVLDPKDNAEVPQPYVDFSVGDTYPINLIGLFVGDKRVVEITTDFTAGTAVWTVEFDQSTYTSDPLKSVVKAVQMLLDRFDELRFQPSSLGGDGLDDHIHDKESVPSVLVASNDASEQVREMADYVCNGADDEVEIQAAVDSLGDDGGRVLLSRGTFNISANVISLAATGGISLHGMGRQATILNCVSDNGSAIHIEFFVHIAHLAMYGVPTTRTEAAIGASQSNIGIGVSGHHSIIEDVYFAHFDTAVYLAGNDWQINNCIFDFNILSAVLDDAVWTGTQITNNVIQVGHLQMGAGVNWTVSDNQMRFSLITDGADHFIIADNHWGDDGTSFDDSNIDLLNGEHFAITGNMMEGSGDHWVKLDTMEQGIVSGNHSDGADTSYWLIDCVGITVGPNTVGLCTRGMILDGCNRCVVQGNLIGTFEGQTGDGFISEHGIQLTDSSNCNIQGNTIDGAGSVLDDTWDAVILDGNSDRNSIHGNKFMPAVATSPRFGINISASTCDNNRIGDNDYGILVDYATHPLNDIGTGTKYPTARTADMSKGGALSTGAGVAFYPFAEDSIYLDAHATVGSAPSGGPVTVDINKNGSTSIYLTATNPSIASGSQIGSKAPGDPTIFAEDDYVSLDLDAVNGAADFTCVVRFLMG